MRVTLAQLNPIVGDLEGNLKKIKDTIRENAQRSDLLVFPELVLSGYPPRDLLKNPDFLNEISETLEKLVLFSSDYSDKGLILGTPFPVDESKNGALYNAALFISDGKIRQVRGKSLFSPHDIFDEKAYFISYPEIEPFEFMGEWIGLTVCEDIWKTSNSYPNFPPSSNPVKILKEKGATIIINIAASAFCMEKLNLRYYEIQKHIQTHKIPFVFLNQVGGNDELIFDGSSFVFDDEGKTMAAFPSFKEHTGTVDVLSKGSFFEFKIPEKESLLFSALSLGLRDYVEKCGFSKVVLGISGGIDSALVAAIAADALGASNVVGVTMPSEYTAKESFILADELVRNLGVEHKEIPIDKIYQEYKDTLIDEVPPEDEVDITYQNIQARIRGNLLMAFSNRYGYLLLSSENKSETAVGYSTLYGDLAGGLAVLSDIYKTDVYRLANYINRDKVLIPPSIISRPPTAELKPSQTDEDTLPPYDILDGILNLYVEKNFSFRQIVGEGYESEIVTWVIEAIKKSEHKRKQSPPGLRVTSRAFGSGWRMPIARLY